MKKMYKTILLGLFTVIVSYGYASAKGGSNKPTPKNNDSLINSKSNIVIFKMITGATPSNPIGTLKKACKVARTSTPHPLTYAPPIHYVKPVSYLIRTIFHLL